MGKYDDIINLPHHVSTTHHHMSMAERAAQFQAFRPLAGYEDAVRATAKLAEEQANKIDTEEFADA